jgi:flagellar hook-basal body complex protein FliE
MQTRLDLYSRNLGTLGGIGQDRTPSAQLPVVGASDTSFGDALTKAISEVSDTRDRASDLVQRFAAGENVELHQVMAASEEAGLALDLMIELRNKVVEAYRSVIAMQS